MKQTTYTIICIIILTTNCINFNIVNARGFSLFWKSFQKTNGATVRISSWRNLVQQVSSSAQNQQQPSSSSSPPPTCSKDSCADCHFNDVCTNAGCSWDDTVPANGPVPWCTPIKNNETNQQQTS